MIARILRRVEGSAVVEMAIVLPLFVLLALWAVYFTELSIVRIRQQEASRFLTWEATTQALVDFGSGRHAPRSQAMRREALARTAARYRNLEGHNLSERSGRWLARPRLRHLDLAPVVLGAAPTDAVGHEVLGELERSVAGDPLLPAFRSMLRGLEGGLGHTLRAMGFSLEVGVHTRVAVEVDNEFLVGEGLVFPERLRRIAFEEAQSLLESETWALGEGSDVGLADTDHPFTRQVERMTYFGIGDGLDRAFRDAAFVRELLPLPPSVRVVSQRYVDPADDGTRLGCEGEPLSATGKWRNGTKAKTPEDRMSPVKCFDTLPMEANGLGAGYEGDPSYRQFRARREGYMGCGAHGGCDG